MSPVQDLTHNAKELGFAEAIDIIEQLRPVTGLDLVDVGCGRGDLTRQLAGRGARVVGAEPDPVQAVRNRTSVPIPGVCFVEAPGQDLPIDDCSVDGVILRFSLNHVPADLMDLALLEAVRVLRPGNGFLLVMEPLLTGSLEALYKPFHDETKMRILACKALKRTAEPRFENAREYRFEETVAYADFTAFVDEVTGSTYSGIVREDVETPEIRTLFERGKSAEGFVFTQHVRVNLYSAPKPAAGGA